jgi:hypothetical protein
MLIAIALLALTDVAMAQSKHPQDVQKINAAPPSAKITPAQRAQVNQAPQRRRGVQQCGKHSNGGYTGLTDCAAAPWSPADCPRSAFKRTVAPDSAKLFSSLFRKP